jgi:hypothetical protein
MAIFVGRILQVGLQRSKQFVLLRLYLGDLVNNSVAIFSIEVMGNDYQHLACNAGFIVPSSGAAPENFGISGQVFRRP